MAGRTWYGRRVDAVPVQLDPSGWRFNGPTSDNSHDGSSLTAAATVLADQGTTTRKVKKDNKRKPDTSWQVEAWAMYDQVGELSYVANAVANRMGQAVLFVSKDGKRVEDSEDRDQILELITPQMVERLGLNLFVAGEGWLCGIPDEEAETGTTWFIASALEVKEKKNDTKVEIRGEKYDKAAIYLVRIWDPHPANWEEADSPVRSALPVLRELVGLTQHVSAQIDSRLAGAGVYWIPNEILNSAKVPEGAAAPQGFSTNPVLNAIMNAMLLPMEDRSNASSVVPLLLGAPGDAIGNIRYDTFSTPFDKNTGALREESIRRLGLSLDAPPELLQGMGDANHWGMWLVRDEVIQAHVSPRLNLITDALTTGFYRPIKKQQGDPDPNSYDVEADVSHLVQRPNRLADASQLHAVNALSDKALREAGGFEETDAPSKADRAVALALTVAAANPQLLDNMPDIVQAVMAVLDGTPQTGPGAVESQRQPGSLRPLVPTNTPTVPQPTATAPNGTPSPNGKGAAPLAEADAAPAAGPPA